MAINFIRKVFLGIACLLIVCTGHASQVEIMLKDQVILSSALYRLEDIATVVTDNEGLRLQISNAVIGRSPRPNFTGRVSKSAIASRLQFLIPEMPNKPKWSGVNIVKLQSVGVSFPGHRLTEFAKSYITEKLNSEYLDFNIAVVSDIKDPILPPGKVTMRSRLASENLATKRLCVWLDVYVEEEFVQTIPVWFSVSIFKNVLATVKAYQTHEAVRENDFLMQYLDITRSGGSAIDNIKDVLGMRLNKPLSVDSILTHEVLQPIPAVAKGQAVKVTVEVGSVFIDTVAISTSDGNLQQKIRLKSPATGEYYSAIVTGPAQAKVD